MVKDFDGKSSSGKVTIIDEFCDDINFVKGEEYEYWEINDEYVGIEDECAKDLAKNDMHGAYIYGKDIVKEFKPYKK